MVLIDAYDTLIIILFFRMRHINDKVKINKLKVK